jgi:hypothetical protein
LSGSSNPNTSVTRWQVSKQSASVVVIDEAETLLEVYKQALGI